MVDYNIEKVSPRPWYKIKTEQIYCGKEGQVVCDCLKDADSAHVVHCVNMHDELVTALEGLVDEEECRYDHHGNCQTHAVNNPCEMEVARKALAKAKGETSKPPTK